MQWTGPVDLARRSRRRLGDDFGVMAVAGARRPAASRRCRSAPTGRASAPRARTSTPRRGFVKWLWIDQTANQLDFAQSYGFHIPARQSLAAKADKLKSGAGRRGGQARHRERPRADPMLWTPKCATAFGDATEPHRQGGRRPGTAEIAKVEDRGRRRAEAGPRLTRGRPGGIDRGRAGTAGRRPATARGRRSARCAGARTATCGSGSSSARSSSGCWSSSTSRSSGASASASSRPATPSPRRSSSGSATTSTCCATRRSARSLLTFLVFAVFIVPTTFALSLGAGAAGPSRPVVMQPFFRSVFFLPTACSYVVAVADLEDVDLQRRPVRVWPTRCSAGSAIDSIAVAGLGRPAVVLARHRHRAAVAAGRLLHDPVPRRPAADHARRSTRRPRSTAPRRLEGVPLHHLAAAAGDVDRGAAAPAHQRVPGVRRVLQPALSTFGTYPPYARPPLVYLYYTALGSRSGLRPRQRRAPSSSRWSSPSSRWRRAACSGSATGATDGDRAQRRPVARAVGSGARYVACVARAPCSSSSRSTCCVRNGFCAEADITSPDWTLFPSRLQWGNITELFDNPAVPMARSLLNSRAHRGDPDGRSCSSARLAGYGLARIPYRWSNVVFYAITATLLIPAAVTFVPSFVLVSTLGWVSHAARPDRPGPVPGVRDVPLPAVLPRLPQELEEAARIDGLGYWGTFWRIVVPNSLGFVAAIGTITFIGSVERLPLAAGHRPGPGVVDRADRPVDLPHRADQSTCRAVHGRRRRDRAAAADVPLPPALDRRRASSAPASTSRRACLNSWHPWRGMGPLGCRQSSGKTTAGRRKDRLGTAYDPWPPPKGGRPSFDVVLARRHRLPRHHLHRPAGCPPAAPRCGPRAWARARAGSPTWPSRPAGSACAPRWRRRSATTTTATSAGAPSRSRSASTCPAPGGSTTGTRRSPCRWPSTATAAW